MSIKPLSIVGTPLDTRELPLSPAQQIQLAISIDRVVYRGHTALEEWLNGQIPRYEQYTSLRDALMEPFLALEK
jgi:hypothetical protein